MKTIKIDPRPGGKNTNVLDQLYKVILKGEQSAVFLRPKGNVHILPEIKLDTIKAEERGKASIQEACRIRERLMQLPVIRGQHGETAIRRDEVLAIIAEAYGT
jgi:hypothetical protein